MLHSGKALPGTEGQKNTATKKTSLLISNVFRKRSWLKGENVKKSNEEKPQLKRIRRQERGRKEQCFLKKQNMGTPESEEAARTMLAQQQVTTQDQGHRPHPHSSSPLTISHCFPEVTPLTCPKPLGETLVASSSISRN